MEKITDKMAKLALEADGNVIGESFIIQPDKNLTAKLGSLFGIIEIYNINDVFLDGFLSAISDLKTEYYLPPFNPEKGVEKRFEEAISRANRRIFAASNQAIEEIDLRNVSAAIGLFHGNKIYLSSAGRVKGLFYRRKKNQELLIIDILSGNGEARFRPEPEKIFANILSGELSRRDALLLINEEFLGVFSQKELGEIVLGNPAPEAVKIIDDSLREKIAKKNFYAVTITPAVEPELLPALAVTEEAEDPTVSTKPFRDNAKPLKSQTIHNDTLQPPERKTLPTQQSIDRLLFTQVRTEKYLTPSLLPQWRKVLLIIAVTVKKSFFFLLRQIKKLFLGAMGLISNWRKKQSASPGAGKPAPAEPEKILASFEPPTPIIEKKKKPANGLTAKINGFINSQIEKFLSLKKGQQIILIIGLILIFFFSQSVVMIGRASDTPKNNTANGNIAKQIEAQLNSAEALNIFNDEAGAVQAIKSARELLAQIPDKRLNKSFKSGLADKINETAKKLQKINYLDNPAVTADFFANQNQMPAELVGLAKTGQIFWAFDNLTRNLHRLDPAMGKVTLATTSAPQIMKLAAIDDKNLILQAEGKIYYKYEIAKSAISKTKPAKDYFQVKLPAVVSPLIDPSLASSTIDMSVTSEAYSFYLDGSAGRVVAVDKNGILKKQYYSEKFQGASAIIAAYKEKRLWLYNAGKVYQVDLDF